jgi:hypothetical protein
MHLNLNLKKQEILQVIMNIKAKLIELNQIHQCL